MSKFDFFLIVITLFLVVGNLIDNQPTNITETNTDGYYATKTMIGD